MLKPNDKIKVPHFPVLCRYERCKLSCLLRSYLNSRLILLAAQLIFGNLLITLPIYPQVAQAPISFNSWLTPQQPQQPQVPQRQPSQEPSPPRPTDEVQTPPPPPSPPSPSR